VELAEKFPFVYAAVGFHPEETPSAELSDLEEIRRLASHEKVVAIGEIGLDYYWVKEEEGRKKEQEFFRAQMALAKERNLPVIVHDREAHGDTLAIVKEFPNVRGVFHCYSGSVEMAQELVKMGWMLSFTGVLTYHNARKAVEVAEAIPLEHLMIETDSPYMSPVPYRGKRNHSGYVRHVCEKLAEIKGIPFEQCAEITLKNGCRFFGISFLETP
jgi:TatD DNase family protein